MLSIKKGVNIAGIQPEITVALIVSSQIFQKAGYDCIVTSVKDGNHSRGSLHHVGLAIDLRVRHIESDSMRQIIADKISNSLGEQYDAILESDHLHIEFQPK